MRVLPEAEKVRADYRTVAIIDQSLITLAIRKKFQIVNATEPGDGLGNALGQTFKSSAGTQFSLIQLAQAPDPDNKHTNIEIALGTEHEMSENLKVILNDIGVKRENLTWAWPGLGL